MAGRAADAPGRDEWKAREEATWQGEGIESDGTIWENGLKMVIFTRHTLWIPLVN